VVCALIRRDLTGEGCDVDLSQFQAALSCIGPTAVEAALGGRGLGSLGNRVDGYAPHGVYPSRAPDEWVAISVLDERMWQALRQIEGLDGLARDARFETLAGRLQCQDDLDDLLSVWSGGRSAQEAAAELQAVGVAASPVLDNWGVLVDPHLQARNFFGVKPHPRFGGELVYGQAISLSETPAVSSRAAPAFGQDTRAILRDLCGMGDEEIQASIESGAVHEMVHPEVHLERPYLHWIRSLLPLDWPPSTQIDPARILFDRLADETGQP
jgi:crotonobetainyl-CoA:carnitine CoA-transferase CaiB-like acyl-CoA transferase